MHAEYKCDCGVEHGSLTDHGQSERKCADCASGKWNGKRPVYPPGHADATRTHFVPFLKQQAARGDERATKMLEEILGEQPKEKPEQPTRHEAEFDKTTAEEAAN